MRQNKFKYLVMIAMSVLMLLQLPHLGELAHQLSHLVFGGHHHSYESHEARGDHDHSLLKIVFSPETNPIETGPLPLISSPNHPVFIILEIHCFPIFIFPTFLVKVPAYVPYIPQALFFSIFLPPG